MRISIVCQSNPNLFPTLYYIAVQLANLGNDVQFISRHKPAGFGPLPRNMELRPVILVTGKISKKIPVLRSSNIRMLYDIMMFNPDMIVAEHEYLIPGLLYKKMSLMNKKKVIGYFVDYYNDTEGMKRVGRWSGELDGYVDICHVRQSWRHADWPNMRAKTFIMRLGPLRQENAAIEEHSGPIRMVYTGSRNALKMLNKDRLSRFINRICERGIAFDWYLLGTADMKASDEMLSEARALCNSQLYAVKPPVPKAELMGILGNYDAGLLWAPQADSDRNDEFQSRYLLSAASNKVGEYIAAGLVVAHTGNPGLSYLPEEVCAVIDPTDPVAGADELAAALADRVTVERKRQAALRYHLDEMNFEAQAAPFIDYVMGSSARAGS